MENENQVYSGKCVWFNDKVGIGFIAKEDGSGDLFVHHSNIKMEGFRSLAAGQAVTYKLGANHKGPQAVEVSPVK